MEAIKQSKTRRHKKRSGKKATPQVPVSAAAAIAPPAGFRTPMPFAGTPERVDEIFKFLLEHGIEASAILPDAVPRKQTRSLPEEDFDRDSAVRHETDISMGPDRDDADAEMTE